MNTHKTQTTARKLTNNKQGGFTVLEVIVVLAIAGLILAALAWGISKAFASNGIKDEATSTSKVFSALPDLRSTGGYGAAGTNLVPQLISQNEIPAMWTVSAGVPQNTFGGTVTVVSNGTNVTVTSSNMTVDGCTKLAVKLSLASPGLSTKINAGTAIIGPVASAIATTQCLAAGANTIAWTTVN